MKRILYLFAALALFAGCKNAPEQKVMARPVPERADDFVFENNLIAGRFYGEALEGNPTSPGMDIWVKLPGKLVADEWYAQAQTDGSYYHRDHGGKDCYKVAVSLGGGASVPLIDGLMRFPATNYRSCEILEQTPEKIVFSLHYPEWEAAEGIFVSLDKKICVEADSYFICVTDSYNFSGTDTLLVAAGIKLHGAQETVAETLEQTDRYAIWEKASDQSVEPEDGMLGVAVVMPGANGLLVSKELDHALLLKTIRSGESICYQAGSCWSKGEIKTPEDWFETVSATSCCGGCCK